MADCILYSSFNRTLCLCLVVLIFLPAVSFYLSSKLHCFFKFWLIVSYDVRFMHLNMIANFFTH